MLSGRPAYRRSRNGTPVTAPRHHYRRQPGGTGRAADQLRYGTFVVGEDIERGTYKTSGPDSSGIGSCYWARLRDTSGDFKAIITNGNTEGPATVTISGNDGVFESSRCGTWQKR